MRALAASAALEGRWGDTQLACRQLQEVHDLMQPEANEALFEFLMPAGFVLERWGAWAQLRRLVQVVDATVAATGQGYADPWRSTAHAWLSLASSAEAIGPSSRTVEDLRAEVRELLRSRCGPESRG